MTLVATMVVALAGPAHAADDDEPTPDAPAATAGATANAVRVNSEVRALRGVESTIDVAVPAGLDPVRLSGTLRIDEPRLDAEVSVNGIVVHTSDGKRTEKFTATVPASERTEDVLTIGVRYRDFDGQNVACRLLQPTFASLTNLAVTYRGTEKAPTSVGAFFPQQSPQIVVQVPRNADRSVAEAGLNAVAALSRRYPNTTTIQVRPQDAKLPAFRTGARLVRIEAGSGPARASVSRTGRWPVLTVSGKSGLPDAAAALADPALALVSGRTAQKLTFSSTAREDRRLRRPLSDVVVGDRLTLTGYGTTTSYLQIPQDLFGESISRLGLHLVGTHTAVARRGQVQLDVLANDLLIDSVSFDADSKPQFTLNTHIPSAALRGTNALVLRMSAVPASGSCATDLSQLPVEVHVDLADSSVRGRPGPGELTGFTRFPQTLKGVLPVAIRANPSGFDAELRRAAALVVPLQRAAAGPLAVKLVKPDDFVSGSESGLLVGGSRADADQLDAPLRLAPAQVMTYLDARFQVLTNQPFVALEAFHQGERDVLFLGGWKVDGAGYGTLANRLTSTVERNTWETLSDDVFVATGSDKPFSLNSNAVIPQPERIDGKRAFAKWFVGGVAVLLVLLGINALWTRRRKRKIGRLIDAQEDAHGSGRESDPSP